MTKLIPYYKRWNLPIRYGLLAILLAYTIIKGVIPGWNAIITDFPNYYTSARLTIEGENVQKLYDDAWFQQKIYDNDMDALGKFSPQPPFTALVMTPIAFLAPIMAKRIWMILSLLFAGGVIFFIHKLFKWTWLSASIGLLLMGRALTNDLYYGQLYLMVVFLMLLSIWLVETKNMQVLAGIILAVITVLKYFPILIVGYALCVKKYRLVAASISTFVILGIFQVLFFGWDVVRFYLVDVLLAHLTGDIPGQGGFAIAYQSWPSLLNNLFVINGQANPNPVFDWALGKTLFMTIIYGTVVIASGFYGYKVRKSAIALPQKNQLILALFMLTALTLLPATASYHFLFLLIPFCILVTSEWGFLEVLILIAVIAINFAPYPFSSTDNIFMLILSYPRLIAISFILIITYFKLHQQLKIEI